MLSISQTAGYAIKAMSCMSGPDGEPMLVQDISDAEGIAKPYLSKIIHALAGKEIVLTKRGYKGGVTLARPADKITLLEIANAVDGEGWLERCILGLDKCTDDRACPLHQFWKPTRGRIYEELSRKTVAEVAEFEARKKGPVRARVK